MSVCVCVCGNAPIFRLYRVRTHTQHEIAFLWRKRQINQLSAVSSAKWDVNSWVASDFRISQPAQLGDCRLSAVAGSVSGSSFFGRQFFICKLWREEFLCCAGADSVPVQTRFNCFLFSGKHKTNVCLCWNCGFAFVFVSLKLFCDSNYLYNDKIL